MGLTFGFTLIVIAALLIAAEAHQHTLKNPEKFSARFEYGDGIYYVSSERLDWFTARKLCLSEGAYLVAMETAEEYTAVKNALVEDLYWTGGIDVYTPGSFYWDHSGLSLSETYSEWAPTEPNNVSGDEHCVEMSLYGLKWIDQICDKDRIVICEYH